ncbi:MAG TPA: antibiotic biosynthesis monooxygenase [Candidatus Limnocylindria bacterium]|nr:antibiotic biosynthesis monooxygenase [Candidatus Limnocylindria bacterium]
MLVIVWEFEVKPERVEDFESLYREDGAWAELFRASPGFVSTTPMRDLRNPRRFMVADRWTSEQTFEEFKHTHEQPYRALDERCQRLTEREVEIGRFDFPH